MMSMRRVLVVLFACNLAAHAKDTAPVQEGFLKSAFADASLAIIESPPDTPQVSPEPSPRPAPPAPTPKPKAPVHPQTHDVTPAPPKKATEHTKSPKSADPTSVFETIKQEMSTQLRQENVQWINALIGLALGAVMVFDGRFVFKWIVIFCVGFFAYTMSMAELSDKYGMQLSNPVRIVGAVEVGLCAGFVSWNGFEGVKYILGMILGFWLGHQLQVFGMAHDFGAFENGLFLLVLYTILVAGGMCVVGVESSHQKIMAFVMSLIGGSLISASIAYFLMLACWMNRISLPALQLPEHIAPYVDLFKLLWGQTTPVGIWATSNYGLSVTRYMDRIVGTIVWIIFTPIGFWVQMRAGKNAGTDKDREAKLGQGSRNTWVPNRFRRGVQNESAKESLLDGGR